MERKIDQEDWPNVDLLRVEIRQSPQWSKFREVVPIFSRRPYDSWCLFFTGLCEDDEGIDWKLAGFALCLPEDVTNVTARFSEATDEANQEFRAFLGRGLLNTDDLENARRVRDLILLEGSSASSDNGDGSRCGA